MFEWRWMKSWTVTWYTIQWNMLVSAIPKHATVVQRKTISWTFGWSPNLSVTISMKTIEPEVFKFTNFVHWQPWWQFSEKFVFTPQLHSYICPAAVLVGLDREVPFASLDGYTALLSKVSSMLSCWVNLNISLFDRKLSGFLRQLPR